ncbi:MAG: ATP-dependent helicase HrpB [Aquisalimonadaceae bacterium]
MQLPIDTVLPELLSALTGGTAAVLQAPPGAGKTTRVPLALLDSPWLQGRRIVMLEPRRLAARAAAGYMSACLGEAVGQTVGYRMRQDTRVGARTRIEVVTEGVLTRLLQDAPDLSDYGAVIFDEFHERSLQADLGLALVLEVQQALREDLRLLVMSATLDAEPVARLLGGAPLITSEGRSYSVQVHYAPSTRDTRLEAQVASVVRRAVREEGGSVLAFLPGQREIGRVQQALTGALPPDVFIAPLYGNLSQAEQDAAIRPASGGQRKIVLATNIAETSLTIDGVRVVVDSGLERRSRFDPVSGMTRLVTGRISRSAAIQRAGRAGRLEPGVCYRLWAEEEHDRLAGQATAEILEADLAPLVMELAQWGAATPRQLSWLDLPPAPAWDQARELLTELQALNADGTLTKHGRAMQTMGVHPRLSHMLIEGRKLGWGRLACELAVLLSERDVLTGDRGRQTDVTSRIRLLRTGREGKLQPLQAQARRLNQRLGGESRPETASSPGLLLGFAYPDRIAWRRQGEAPRYLLANGRGAYLRGTDQLRQSPFLVAAELDGAPREACIYLAATIDRDIIDSHFLHIVSHQDAVYWDEATQAVAARRQRRLGAIVLEDAPLPDPDPQVLLDCLLAAIRRKGLDVFPWDDATRQWRARVKLMRELEPDEWPDTSDASLLANLETWAAPFLQGVTRLAHLRGFPLQDALAAWLGYMHQQRLDVQAPSRWQVPTGSRILIDYTAGEAPVLAVKLQELFGEAKTPTIADGRVPLLLHLLSPARRPVQVTRDLAGFWAGSYSDVRKDLRGRYPRHPWPEQPAKAAPTRYTLRRGKN